MEYARIENSNVIQRKNDDGTNTYFDANGDHPFAIVFRQHVKDGGPVSKVQLADTSKVSTRAERPMADFVSILISKGIVQDTDLPQSVSDFVEANRSKSNVGSEQPSIIERAGNAGK